MSKEAGKMNDTILEVKDLSVTFTQYERGFSRRTIHAVEKMDLEIKSGEIVAVVGSSGSGKSLLAHAIMGILPYNSEMDGEIRFLGEPLTEKKVKRLRGHEIVLVPQSVSYLDPLMKIGDQIQNGKKDVSVKEKCLEVLKRYGLAPDIRGKYPFQLSGGMTRRVLISTAVMEKPKLVIADEPTPGLHLEAATRVMGHFREMADDGAGVLLITHDIELTLRVADRIAVFQDGTVVEETAVASFASPDLLQHSFSRKLWHALPEHGMRCEGHTSDPGELNDPARLRSLSSIVRSAVPDRSASLQKKKDPQPPSPLASCENESVETRSLQAKGICFGYSGKQVLRDFNLTIEPGERVALRAPSGTGKTTLCCILAGYLQPASGTVLADGAPLPRSGASPVQLVAQHPERMMDPAIPIRRSLAEATTEPEDAQALASWEEKGDGIEGGSMVPRLLESLGVQREWLERFPVELSGGELQRCCIARALMARPRYLICDEISTMLDAATQACLWRFLVDHAQINGVGMVLVTHSDALLDHIATRIVELP